MLAKKMPSSPTWSTIAAQFLCQICGADRDRDRRRMTRGAVSQREGGLEWLWSERMGDDAQPVKAALNKRERPAPTRGCDTKPPMTVTDMRGREARAHALIPLCACASVFVSCALRMRRML